MRVVLESAVVRGMRVGLSPVSDFEMCAHEVAMAAVWEVGAVGVELFDSCNGRGSGGGGNAGTGSSGGRSVGGNAEGW